MLILVFLHPSSALFGKQAEWVLYHELVLTTKEYMHCTTSIEPKWLVDAAPTFFKVAPTDRLSKRKKAEKIQPLYNKWQTEDDWRISAQRRVGRTNNKRKTKEKKDGTSTCMHSRET